MFILSKACQCANANAKIQDAVSILILMKDESHVT